MERRLVHMRSVSLCNNKGNLLRCDHGHRCHEHNGVPGCYSLCQPTPYGIWTPESCNEGTCSLSDATDPSANATTICKCNDGFFLQGGECKSHAQTVAIVAGCLGSSVLILIIIVIVCTVKQRSTPVPKASENIEMMPNNEANNGKHDKEVSLCFDNKALSHEEHRINDEMKTKYKLSDSLRVRLEKEHGNFFPPPFMDGDERN
ncbi:unnamed protein product [Owenia fusiformis]|uniref:Uncharacterized protein n=1 Tax=Owenia fusiformis TaxID=6347 RepID=A0A8J1UPG6_OWEFU|nr:unnamed protein product [Owenia fusiformis]